jgi:hypothetical protein
LVTYEKLRADVLNAAARPEGLAAVVYHGMLHGLRVILTETSPSTPSLLPPALAVEPGHLDQDLLRLIANMVLQSQSQVTHVY